MKNFAKTHSRAGSGLKAPEVTIQSHISSGLPAFTVVGLLETSVRESKERVRSSIINSNFKFPRGRITVSLAPANLPKKGGRYDLSVAISILIASGQIPDNVDNVEFYGELGLDGLLSPVDKLFPSILQSAKLNKTIIIPKGSDVNLSLIKGNILTASSLLEVCGFIADNNKLLPLEYQEIPQIKNNKDLSEVKGQFLAKRALEIAACGRHNLLFSGTPGSGKTMLAERITTIMPDLSFEQKLEVMAIYSIANQEFKDCENIVFRAPHHLSSAVSLVGGGADPKPGEVSLAHNGVLFLDELPEFSRSVLEVLRQPLESKTINISRAKTQVSYPANFQLIAAQNPCPCGYYGDKSNRCHCTFEQIYRYKNKISGPFLDRIDMRLKISALTKQEILFDNPTQNIENSTTIKARVIKAYNTQIYRQGVVNSELNIAKLDEIIPLTNSQKNMLASAIDKLNLSTRAYHKVLKVARTIADLDNMTNVADKHLIEALSYQR